MKRNVPIRLIIVRGKIFPAVVQSLKSLGEGDWPLEIALVVTSVGVAANKPGQGSGVGVDLGGDHTHRGSMVRPRDE